MGEVCPQLSGLLPGSSSGCLAPDCTPSHPCRAQPPGRVRNEPSRAGSWAQHTVQGSGQQERESGVQLGRPAELPGEGAPRQKSLEHGSRWRQTDPSWQGEYFGIWIKEKGTNHGGGSLAGVRGEGLGSWRPDGVSLTHLQPPARLPALSGGARFIDQEIGLCPGHDPGGCCADHPLRVHNTTRCWACNQVVPSCTHTHPRPSHDSPPSRSQTIS